MPWWKEGREFWGQTWSLEWDPWSSNAHCPGGCTAGVCWNRYCRQICTLVVLKWGSRARPSPFSDSRTQPLVVSSGSLWSGMSDALLLWLLLPLFMGWKAPLAQAHQCHLAAVMIYSRKDIACNCQGRFSNLIRNSSTLADDLLLKNKAFILSLFSSPFAHVSLDPSTRAMMSRGWDESHPIFHEPSRAACKQMTAWPIAVSILLAPPALYVVSEPQQAPHAC